MITTEINMTFAEALLRDLDAALTDLTPVMDRLGEQLTRSTKERFKEGTAPDGTKWAPKSATTLARYGAKADARPLFGPTGLLSQQIFHQADAQSVEWGSNLIYSAVMQFGAAKGAFGTMSNGASIPWGNIPARPFIGVSAEDEVQIIDILSEWLQTAADQGA